MLWIDSRVFLREQRYPEVTFLTYKDRKRVLVGENFHSFPLLFLLDFPRSLVELGRSNIVQFNHSFFSNYSFVGSHLVDRLMLQGHEVIVADNFFTGRKRNIEHWIGHENFELINHDIVNPLYIEGNATQTTEFPLFDLLNLVDQIYHLASPASPPHYMYNPVKTIKVNTIGTINMLGLSRRVRARILFASTSEVYGDPEVHPQKESYFGNVNSFGPRSCYDESKRVAEAMFYAYAQQV